MNSTKYTVLDDLHLDVGEDIGKILSKEEYKYLGMKITTNGKQDKEIKFRINLYKMAISILNGILWDKQITAETKTQI